MKHFTKLLASLALLIFMVAFISCDNPSSSDNNTDNNTDTTPATQVRAVFVASYEVTHGEETVLITDTITFEADGTFSVYSVEKQEDSVVFEGTVGKGTYTGNASVDGVIVMTVTHLLGDDGESFVNVADVPDYPYKEPMQMSIQDGKCSFLNDTAVFIRQ